MNIERIQKINNLALDLMNQGLAVDREDAINKAEKVFRQEDGDYSSIRERLEDSKEKVPKKEQEQEVDLSQDKIKEILNQNTQFIVKKFKEFQDKISNMEGEMALFKTKLAHLRQPPVQQFVSTAAPRQQETPPPASGNVEKPAASHPRTGSFKDDEVSIEKFFYMGNK